MLRLGLIWMLMCLLLLLSTSPCTALPPPSPFFCFLLPRKLTSMSPLFCLPAEERYVIRSGAAREQEAGGIFLHSKGYDMSCQVLYSSLPVIACSLLPRSTAILPIINSLFRCHGVASISRRKCLAGHATSGNKT